jgi:hypothetical protein
MATCLITEFSTAQEDDQGRSIPVAKSELATQSVSYTTAAQSAAFAATCKFVRVIADAEVFLKFGSNPTADASSIRLPADTVEYFGVEQGAKVSCYDGIS